MGTYHCSRNHKYWGINKGKLEEVVEVFVGGVEFSRRFRDKFNKVFLEEWEKRELQVSNDALDCGKRIAEKEYELRELKEKIKALTSPTAIKMIEDDIEKAQQERAGLIQKRDNKEHEQLDIQTVLNRVSYYMEHLDELILTGTDPLQNAAMFGLLFEKKPTYDELVNGTPKLAPIVGLKEAFEASEEQFVTPRGIEPRFSG